MSIEADSSPSVDVGPWRAGVFDAVPFAVAIVPFGLAIGSAGATAEMSLPATLFGAVALLAGASQLAATDVVADGGRLGSLLIVVLLLNARFVLYGTGVSTWFAGRPKGRRLLLAVPIIDQTFMLCQQRFSTETDENWRERYYLGATAALVAAYLTCQAIGHSVGTAVPVGVGLHLAAPLVFTGMITVAIPERSEAVAAVTAAALLLAISPILGPVGLPIAVVGGIMAGAATADNRSRSEAIS